MPLFHRIGSVYFSVANTDETVEKAVSTGGTVFAPAFDTPFGRVAFLIDPFGASFNVVQMSRPTN